MSLTFKDDHKGKHQSWSANIELSGWEEGEFSLSLTAYGASKEEARLNFDSLAQAAVRKICEAALESHIDGQTLTSHKGSGHE